MMTVRYPFSIFVATKHIAAANHQRPIHEKCLRFAVPKCSSFERSRPEGSAHAYVGDRLAIGGPSYGSEEFVVP